MVDLANKTRPGPGDVAAFISTVPHEGRRQDAQTLLPIFERITGWPAQMWGNNIAGFGRYEYRYASGREGAFMVTGFSPRASNTSLYIMPGHQDMREMLSRLGKHKAGKSCINITRLEAVDLAVVEEIIRAAIVQMQSQYKVFAR